MQYLDPIVRYGVAIEENVANCLKQYSSEKKTELRQTIITFLTIVTISKK